MACHRPHVGRDAEFGDDSIGAGVCAGDVAKLGGTRVNKQRTVRCNHDGEVRWRCMEEVCIGWGSAVGVGEWKLMTKQGHCTSGQHSVFSSEVTTALLSPGAKANQGL